MNRKWIGIDEFSYRFLAFSGDQKQRAYHHFAVRRLQWPCQYDVYPEIIARFDKRTVGRIMLQPERKRVRPVKRVDGK